MSRTTCSSTACAIATPSCVLVPRPSSSRITSERGVACLRMSEVSESSTMKVDSPESMLSKAPMRVKTASSMPRRAEVAGT